MKSSKRAGSKKAPPQGHTFRGRAAQRLRRSIPADVLARRTVSPAGDLTEEGLHRLTLGRLRIIALLGLALILADLVLSLTGEEIRIVQDQGALYLIRPAAGDSAGHITLHARVRSGSATYEDSFAIRLDPQRSGSDTAPAKTEASQNASGEDLIRSEFRSIAAGFNTDLSRRRVPLPAALDSGESITWSRAREANTLLLTAMTAAMMLLVYHGRLRPLQRQDQARRQSVHRQLPVFLNELVLLLNAGLVLSRAFEITAARMCGTKDDDGADDYFRSSLARISQSMQTTNASLQEELHAFARASGVSELMRVCGIISDNINKGAELHRKLERESERLWLARRLDAEERGRLAETKMTLPLSIFLLVLIVITISPALLQL